MDCSHPSQFELILCDAKRHHTEGFIVVKIRYMWEPDVVFYVNFHNLKRNSKENLFPFFVKIDYQICPQSDFFSMRKNHSLIKLNYFLMLI